MSKTIKNYDDENFSFSTAMENEAPDDWVQKEIESVLIDSDHDPYKNDTTNEDTKLIKYNERLSSIKENIDNLNKEIIDCQKEIDKWEILIKEKEKIIEKNKNILNDIIEDNSKVFKIFKAIKGRDQLTEAREYMINNMMYQYSSLNYGEEYKVIIVIDHNVDKEFINKTITFIDDIEKSIKNSKKELIKIKNEWRSMISHRSKLENDLYNLRNNYMEEKRKYPYNGISRNYIDTNIYIDYVDFGKTLKEAFGINGSGILHGIKL